MACVGSEPMPTSPSRSQRFFENLRIVSSGPVERQRRQHGVDAAAVRQARVDHRRGLVDAAPDLSDDLVDDPPQVVLVGEPHRVFCSLPARSTQTSAGPLTMTSVIAVVVEQRLDRAVAKDVVGDLLNEPVAVGDRQPALLREPVADVGEHHFVQRARCRATRCRAAARDRR